MLPDYKGGSIVNLVSSFAKRYKVKHRYKPVSQWKLSEKKTTLFIVLDGLGYEWLCKYGKGSFLHTHMVRKLTSVFPSATSSAMTCLQFGLPSQQHGIPGWFTYFREIGTVALPLPFVTLGGHAPLDLFSISREEFFPGKSFCEQLPVQTFTIYPEHIAEVIAGSMRGKKNHVIGYDSVDDFFDSVHAGCTYNNRKKFVFAYWPEFDSLCHHYGTKHKLVREHFLELDAGVKHLCESLTNTAVVVTADHGLIDSPKRKRIDLASHPKLKELLTVQLCGEPRAAFCYVRAGKEKQFREYVKKKLGHACSLHKSSSLVEKGYFGIGKKHPKLLERIGDYTLLMKDDYVIGEGILDEKKQFLTANHGGLSKQELLVPLIVVDC